MREKDLLDLYESVKDQISQRIYEFKSFLDNATEEELFMELTFCLLTPQSKARTAWDAVLNLRDQGLLFKGSAEEIFPAIRGVRFSRTKAKRIVLARQLMKKFDLMKFLKERKPEAEKRAILMELVNGYGMKESSHFLRNVGVGLNLAILDRHILKNLKLLGVIDEAPKSLTRKLYLEIEEKMRAFSKRIGIPMSHLDLLLWYKETGEVFK